MNAPSSAVSHSIQKLQFVAYCIQDNAHNTTHTLAKSFNDGSITLATTFNMSLTHLFLIIDAAHLIHHHNIIQAHTQYSMSVHIICHLFSSRYFSA